MPSLTRRALLAAVAASAVLAGAPALGAPSPTALVTAANALGLTALGEQIAAAPQANHAFSPTSLAGALAILAQGDGTLASALGARDARSLAADWAALSRAAKPAAGGRVALSLAGGLWHAPELAVDADAAARLRGDLAAAVAGLDFTRPEAADGINAWVKDNSGGLIPALFERLSPDTILVLASALAFKADWAMSFDPAETRPDSFATADGKRVEVPMMSRTDNNLLHFDAGDHQAVLLPYADPAFALALALPAPGKPPALLLADGKGWLAADSYAPRPGSIALPRGALSSRYDLNDPKTSLTTVALLAGSRDLSGFGAAWEGKGQSLSQAVQAVALRWDETGTQAAAVTGMAVSRGLVTEDPTTRLRFDRPFAFSLIHRPTGAILLAGLVNEPKL